LIKPTPKSNNGFAPVGQFDLECGAWRIIVMQGDAPAMRIDDLIGDSKAKAGSAF